MSPVRKKNRLKYLITGPPGAGKSTLIAALAEKGFPVIKEVSRDIIITEQKNGKNGIPWGDLVRFNQLVFKETMERLTAKPEALFCDRSLLDNIAYMKLANEEISLEYSQFNYAGFYQRKVFFAPPWKDIYVKDPQRPQDFEAHAEVTKILRICYEAYGFEIIDLPLTSVKGRVDFVLSACNEIVSSHKEY